MIESQHNILIMILLYMGLIVGLMLFEMTGKWYFILVSFIGVFFYPLIANILRKFGYRFTKPSGR